MDKRWYNTNVEKATSMIDVTDNDILSWSHGELNYDLFQEGQDRDFELYNADIFGTTQDDHTLRMGHIKLAVPIVNINYTRGRRPLLPYRIGVPLEKLDRVIHYDAYVVSDPKESGYTKGEIISPKTHEEVEENIAVLTGAKGVEFLLAEKGLSKDIYILENIPVLPWICIEHNPFRYLTFQVLLKNARVKRLMEIDAPGIILECESRMLQEAVDTLISNGAYGHPVLYSSGHFMDSYDEFYDHIVRLINPDEEFTKPEIYPEEEEKLRTFCSKFEKLKENDASFQEKETIVKKYEKALQPIAERAIRKNFMIYKDFYEEMLFWGIGAITHGHTVVADMQYIQNGIIAGIYAFIRKRARFENEEKENE